MYIKIVDLIFKTTMSQSLDTLVNSWFDYHQQLKELRTETKELTDGKKAIETELIGLMESQNVSTHTTGAGTLELIRKTKHKTSASKKQLKDIFEKNKNAINLEQPAQACEFIFNLFPAEEQVSLKAAKTDLP